MLAQSCLMNGGLQKESTKDLFEVVAKQLSCTYISDIKFAEKRKSALKLLSEMELETYPISCLEDMADYLLDEKVHFASADEAHRYFLEKRRA